MPGFARLSSHDSATQPFAPPSGRKYSQPVDCELAGYFSNLNSDVNWFLRYDDFICDETGEINRIVFWGGTYDVNTDAGSGPVANMSGLQVDFYQWTPDGPCGFLAGPVLCSFTLAVEDLHWQYQCSWPVNPLVDFYRYEANLPEPCYQEQGQHFLIMIAAVLKQTGGAQIFAWCATTTEQNTPGGSWLQGTDIWSCGTDNAFELYSTFIPCREDLTADDQVDTEDLFVVLEHWGVCDNPDDCPWDLTGLGNSVPDGIVDIDDVFAVLAAWGPCP